MNENQVTNLKSGRLYFLLFLLVVVASSVAFLFLFDFRKFNSKNVPQKIWGEDYFQFVLALDLDGNGLDISKLGMGLGSSIAFFDLDNDQFAERTAWIVGNDGLLAMDQNGNGEIDNQSELFGNSKKYFDGFGKLQDLDPNNDGVIDKDDELYSKLLIWVDSNQDGVSSANELHPLHDMGITEIRYANPDAVNIYQNESFINLSSTFVRDGKELQIKHIWLKNSAIETKYRKKVNLNVKTLFLPSLRGFGELRDLHVAMSEDESLLNLVQNFVVPWSIEKFQDPQDLDRQIKNIMFRWAGVDNVKDGSRGKFVNAQELTFMERFTGRSYGVNAGGGSNQPISDTQGKMVHDSFVMVYGAMKAQLIAQNGMSSFFEPPLIYSLDRGELNKANISQSGVDHFAEAAAKVPDNKREGYWVGVADFLLFVKPKATFTHQEIDMLDKAISSTLIGSNWEKIAMKAHEKHFGKMTSIGDAYDNYLVTSEGDDEVYGNDGNDTIMGMTGDDLLSGGSGNDVYEFSRGHGNDVIKETSGNEDVIRLTGNDIDRSSIKFEKQPYDLIIHYADKDTVRISNYFADEGSKIEFIEFPDHSRQNLNLLISE